MRLLFVPVALLVIAAVLVDGFETMVLPRRVTRGYRPVRWYYKTVWRLWRSIAGRLPSGRRRESFLGFFGPLSLLPLFALWALMLIVGFGLLLWSIDLPLNAPAAGEPGLAAYFYYSGVTFFTLGYGDVTPATAVGRTLAVFEAGMGLGFMAVIIGYLPSLSQAASQRELTISLLDARAGSPPTAAEGILRAARAGHIASVEPFLAEWERWAAQLLESHLSFPVLVVYRSQHDNQSWLGSLTAVLDGCAQFIAGVKGWSRSIKKNRSPRCYPAMPWPNSARATRSRPRTKHRDRSRGSPRPAHAARRLARRAPTAAFAATIREPAAERSGVGSDPLQRRPGPALGRRRLGSSHGRAGWSEANFRPSEA